MNAPTGQRGGGASARPREQLVALGREWVEPYVNAEHLRRTLDWLLELEPAAPLALRLAALTHDMERHVPGGLQFDPGTMRPDEEAYRIVHSERSARIVGDWLLEQGAPLELAERVRELILLHEIGGTPDADLLQAADSLSFLEVNATLVRRWVEQGRCSGRRGREQLDWMFTRIRVEGARAAAVPLYERAVALVSAADAPPA